MGMSLRSITDDSGSLALDQGQVGVGVVEHAEVVAQPQLGELLFKLDA